MLKGRREVIGFSCRNLNVKGEWCYHMPLKALIIREMRLCLCGGHRRTCNFQPSVDDSKLVNRFSRWATPFPPRRTNWMLVGWLASDLENAPFFRSPKCYILATGIQRKCSASVLRASIHPRLLCPLARFPFSHGT